MQKIYENKYFKLGSWLWILMLLIGLICVMVYFSQNNSNNITNAKIKQLSTAATAGGVLIIIGSVVSIFLSILYVFSGYLIYKNKTHYQNNSKQTLNYLGFSFVFTFTSLVIGLFAITNGNVPSSPIDLETNVTTFPSCFGGFKIFPQINQNNWDGYFISVFVLAFLSFVLHILTAKKVIQLINQTNTIAINVDQHQQQTSDASTKQENHVNEQKSQEDDFLLKKPFENTTTEIIRKKL